MAKIQFGGVDEYIKKLGSVSNPKTIRAACRYAIYPAAGMVADEIKKATPVDTGDLERSVTITDMETSDGITSATVTFAGYDRDGTPNLLKARVLESGRSFDKAGKNPFVRRTRNRVKKRALGMMDAAFSHFIYEKFRK